MSSSTKLSLIIDDARQENFQFAFYDPTLGGVPYFYQSTAHTSPVPPTADESKFVDIIFEGSYCSIIFEPENIGKLYPNRHLNYDIWEYILAASRSNTEFYGLHRRRSAIRSDVWRSEPSFLQTVVPVPSSDARRT